MRAIGRGLRRTLDRPLLKRTFAVALAIVALDWFGSVAIISFAGLVEFFGIAREECHACARAQKFLRQGEPEPARSDDGVEPAARSEH